MKISMSKSVTGMALEITSLCGEGISDRGPRPNFDVVAALAEESGILLGGGGGEPISLVSLTNQGVLRPVLSCCLIGLIGIGPNRRSFD